MERENAGKRNTNVALVERFDLTSCDSKLQVLPLSFNNWLVGRRGSAIPTWWNWSIIPSCGRIGRVIASHSLGMYYNSWLAWKNTNLVTCDRRSTNTSQYQVIVSLAIYPRFGGNSPPMMDFASAPTQSTPNSTSQLPGSNPVQGNE